MPDLTGADKFINSLFESTLPHLIRVKNDASANASGCAIQFAETGDTTFQAMYRVTKARVETVRKICLAMLEDPATVATIKAKIYDVFPDLKPPAVKPPEQPPAAVEGQAK